MCVYDEHLTRPRANCSSLSRSAAKPALRFKGCWRGASRPFIAVGRGALQGRHVHIAVSTLLLLVLYIFNRGFDACSTNSLRLAIPIRLGGCGWYRANDAFQVPRQVTTASPQLSPISSTPSSSLLMSLSSICNLLRSCFLDLRRSDNFRVIFFVFVADSPSAEAFAFRLVITFSFSRI